MLHRQRVSIPVRRSGASACDTAGKDFLTRPCLRAVRPRPDPGSARSPRRSEEHTSELQSLMRISYAVFCLKKKITKQKKTTTDTIRRTRHTRRHYKTT